MTDFLLDLGTLSIGGAVAICVLALAARLSRTRYSARWRCWIWLLLGLRLAIPLSFQLPEVTQVQSPIQIPVPPNTVIYTFEQDDPVVQPPAGSIPEQMPSVDAPPVESPVIKPETPEPPKSEITLFQVVGFVWAAGVIGMLSWYFISHWRFLRYLRRWGDPVFNDRTIRLYNELGNQLELNARPKLRICSGLSAPMLVGVVRPVLLLPEGNFSDDEIRYSILHELTHFKRRDIWLKTLVLWVNAIHWFNPLMWFMTRLVERDTELACDEAALKMLAPEEHGAYGRTLLDAVERLKAAR